MRSRAFSVPRWSAVVAFIVGLVFIAGSSAQARELPSRDDIQQWVTAYLDTLPQFREGDILRQADLDKLRPFLPPRYIDEFDFPEVEFHVSPTGTYAPHEVYMAATEKYAVQTRLADDGALENYVAGRPFARALVDTSDPTSGLKAAWNFNYRWQHYGMNVERYLGALIAKGGRGSKLPGFPDDLIQGGGRVIRHLVALYQRVYHNHLSHLSGSGHIFPLHDAGRFEFKDYVEVLEPYDVRGLRFMVYRYDDARKQDDAWGFIPTLRKVRRLSVHQRDDSIAGTEMTLDDFTGFSGRVLDHTWRFLGWKPILHVMNSRHPYARFYGPDGWLPNDRWELRLCAVVEQTPNTYRNYSSKIYFWDAETYETALALVFDLDGNLWKVNDLLHGWSEDPSQAESDRGKQLPRNIGFTIVDVKQEQATVFSAYTIEYPDVDVEHVEERYDINKLSEGRR